MRRSVRYLLSEDRRLVHRRSVLGESVTPSSRASWLLARLHGDRQTHAAWEQNPCYTRGAVEESAESRSRRRFAYDPARHGAPAGVLAVLPDVKPGGAAVAAPVATLTCGTPCGMRVDGNMSSPPPTPARSPRTGLSRSIATSPAGHVAPDTLPRARPPSGGTGGHFREVYHDVADPRLHQARQVLAHAAEELHA